MKGLSSVEVHERRKSFGFNELPTAKPRGGFAVAFDTVREPMFLLLLSCSVIYLIIGDFGEASLLSSAIFVVVMITFIQERRTERALDALRNLSNPRALVWRDGLLKHIAGKEVVTDDLVSISEGDRVPADGFIIMSKSLKIDESLLTGESVSVGKIDWNGKDKFLQAGGDDTSFIYSGTLVVQGSGTFKVAAIGIATAMGRIGTSLSKTKRPTSSMQQETKRVVRIVATISLSISVGIAAILWFRDRNLLDGVLRGLTFAMSTIPEEFPVVLTVFMAFGAWRISKKKVLTRQINAIETLGSATFLCVDKTGTLTENKMTVAAIWRKDFEIKKIDLEKITLSDQMEEVIAAAARGSDPSPTDPMDIASISAANRFDLQFVQDLVFEKTYPMIRPILAVGQAWKDQKKNEVKISIKGAPEIILELCKSSKAECDEVSKTVKLMASQGLRVLGVAESSAINETLSDGLAQYSYIFFGLVGFNDPVKPGVADAVAECHQAGIKVMMITGDYPETALSVAREIGLENIDDILTGSDMKTLQDNDLAIRLNSVRVLARMVPEHKLRIVEILRKKGEIVAMTGDGVNDAPALKASHIGIAMGGRGTDVAREAAALVLLNDNFTSIVDAIRLGRRIYDNIQKAIAYIIAIHIPIVGLTLGPLLVGMPPILWPVHLAFLELIIDPVCAIAFEAEPEESMVMKRPPRSAAGHLFSKNVLKAGFLEGIFVLVAVYIVFFIFGNRGDIPDHTRAVSFATLIFANVGLILTLRSKIEPAWVFLKRPNPTLRWILLALVLISGAILYIPPVARIFHFAQLSAIDLLIACSAAILSLIGFEIIKVVRKTIFKNGVKIAASQA